MGLVGWQHPLRRRGRCLPPSIRQPDRHLLEADRPGNVDFPRLRGDCPRPNGARRTIRDHRTVGGLGFAAYGVVYLLLLVTIGVLARIYTLQRVWRRVV